MLLVFPLRKHSTLRLILRIVMRDLALDTFGGEKEISPANYPQELKNISQEVISYDKWGTGVGRL